MSVKIVGNVCMYNEIEKGNLTRCLDNMSVYCDEILIWDDCSSDDSQRWASHYPKVDVFTSQKNNQIEELAHKQFLLEESIKRGATHVFWLDCDEVLETNATYNGLRQLCKNMPKNVDAYSFPEFNLWRSQTFVRTDTLFSQARFVRLWKVKPGIAFEVKKGVHCQLYPKTIKNIVEAPYGVIHYGFWNYKKMLVKIGAHQFSKKRFQECAQNNWIMDERNCSVFRLNKNKFPKGCIPGDIWPIPEKRTIDSLVPYPEVKEDISETEFNFIDEAEKDEWNKLHADGYHGDYDSILQRNKNLLQNFAENKVNHNQVANLKFSSKGKVVADIGAGGGWHALEAYLKGADKVYALEVDKTLINNAKKSFEELGIDDFIEYKQIGVDNLTELPKLDIIYSQAVFQHIKFWQVCQWLRWIHQQLKDDGKVYLQFYQLEDGTTLLSNNEDNISNIRLENEIVQQGFSFTRSFVEDVQDPVWYVYELTKRTN